jgi:outer membrane protein
MRFAMHTLLASFMFAGSASAAGMMDALMPDNAPSVVGLAVGMVPDYQGSDDYTVGVAPMARYQFKDSNRYVLLMANELSFNLLNNASWRAGPVLNYSFGRKDVEDDVVDRMETLDGFLEYGAFIQYVSVDPQNPRNRWSIGLTGLTNSQDDNEGYRVRLGTQYFRQVSTAVDINVGAGMWYADGDWNNYYFGVNAGNVGTSGLPVFTADSGVNQVFANIGAIVYLSKNWAVAGGLRYSRMQGDAGDSPLVGGTNGRGSEDQWVGGIGVTYLAW